MNVRRSGGIASLDTLSADVLPVEEHGVLNEEAFHRMISLERKRTERSRKPFLLMLRRHGEWSASRTRTGKALDKILCCPCSVDARDGCYGLVQEPLGCRCNVHRIWG